MMYQRDELMCLMESLGRIRESAESEAVDHHRMVSRQRGQARAGGNLFRGAWMRKAVAEIQDLDVPAKRRELRNDAPVIGIATGRCGEIARHRKHHRLHHNGASYHARAVGDSETVTRMALSSRPSRPSASPRAASASMSNTYRVRNSVVVLVPLNCGRSSRLRKLSGASTDLSVSCARPMSTTIPLSSSRSDRKAACTTKVAPCNCCAGPNTSPRNECAIMICSVTSTANTKNTSRLFGFRIADQRAARVSVRKDRGQTRGQIIECRGRRKQSVEGGIVKQRECRRKSPGMAPARPMRRRNLADL